MAETTPLVEFLVRQPRGRLARLYGNPWTCEAVLRALPAVARHYILRLVCAAPAPIDASVVEAWSQSADAHAAAMQWLVDLSILDHGDAPDTLRLNPVFAKQLTLLFQGLQPPQPRNPGKQAPTAELLSQHANERWEDIMLCIANTDKWFEKYQYIEDVYNLPENLLERAGLLQVCERFVDSEGEDVDADEVNATSVPYWAMTSRGAHFVLEELSAQIWHILHVYIGDDERKLTFLLELAHRECGQAYAVEDEHRELLGELHHLGVVFIRSAASSKRFYPTHLASAIISSTQAVNSSRSLGHIIVESNFRVYVYTASRAWIEVLQIFLKLLCLLPDAVVATISREQMQQAMRTYGLTAQHMSNFLKRNAHPQITAARREDERDKSKTVYDQISLWESELDRYTAHDASYFYEFHSLELFDGLVAYARDAHKLLWHSRDAADAKKCKLVVCAEQDVVGEMRRRIKEYKARAGIR
mmetsp:Transcript_817/g.2296  ORF Transcript_817/g.2296 Transcript_817/m.2296 type:complete len:473 (+) Transcript_817:111-1529(+)